MDKTVAMVVVRLRYTKDGEELCDVYSSGVGNVKEIEYHEPKGNGDKHYVDIYFNDGQIIREFDISFMNFREVQ
jgi:hypothetical protein